jgi:spore maturation protein CgeB
MRVGVVGLMGSEYFAENVADALHRTGHVVTPLGPARSRHRGRFVTGAAGLVREALPRLDERVQSRIARMALEAGCEVVVNTDPYLMPDVVRQLRRDGGRVAFWFPDHVANFGRQLMLLAPYDGIFLKEPHIVERLHANLGLPVNYLPEACNPRWHIAKGIPLKLYGTGFPRWIGDTPARSAHTGRLVFREEKARVLRSAAGVLNNVHPAEISGINGRLFQAAGCGAAVLTEFRPAVPELFAIGDEVLAYHDFDDLVDQATRLLTEPGLTARLGDAAAGRAHRDHTYDLRVATILETVA